MASENVVLVSMMKNEAENCRQMLESVEGLYDQFVIGFDRKSIDGTPEIVRGYMQECGHHGIFYDFDWNNSFADARNLYLQLALEKFPDHPWLLIMDGDDLLSHGNPAKGIPDGREVIRKLTDLPLEQFPYKAANFYVYLDPDEYGIPTLFYPRVHLVRNLPDVRFQFASHNVISVPGDQQVLVREVVILHKQKPKKRAEREKQRVEMNVPNLIEQGKGDGLDGARGLFYLGNTLMDAGNLAGAEKAYLEYLEKSTWADERYQARLHLCALYLMQHRPEDAERHAKEALQEQGQWARAEGYVVLSDCALMRGDVMAAIHWLRMATLCKPPVSGLFLQGHLYTWFPHWRLALLLDLLGCHKEALHHAQQAWQYRPSEEISIGVAALTQQIAEYEARGVPINSIDKLDCYIPLCTTTT